MSDKFGFWNDSDNAVKSVIFWHLTAESG